ncbi:MAG: cytochrome b/b6 domain-containing protein [Pseudomonadota bacterium]
MTEASMENLGESRITVWDRPIRLVHWSLVALLPALWWTAEQGEFTWHMALGVVTLAVLVFRLLWGFVGSSTARFDGFVRGPRAVASYLSRQGLRQSQPIIGHNPLGGWSVLAMLLLLICQVGLGLVAGDPDDHAVGPLNHLVSFTVADRASELHELLFNVVLALIVLHVAAVLGYLLIKRDNLIRPMVTGQKTYTSAVAQPAVARPLRALLCGAVATGLAWWLYAGAPLPLN